MGALLGVLEKAMELFGVKADGDVARWLVVVVIVAVIALVEWRAGLVALVLSVVLFSSVWAAALPKVVAAAKELPGTLTTAGETVSDIVPLRCGGVEPVLSTIRKVESGNQYARLNGNAHTGATASGAYQYTNGTWNGYGGYRRAMDAPPEVQDERARLDVTMFLERHNNDVSVIPVLWYIGHVPSGAEWDQVPWASQGNTLTPRQYQTKWLAEYERQTAACATEVK